MSPWQVEQIGNCTLYCGDCREILPCLDSIDAVVTDPPYGIDQACAIHCTKPSRPHTYIMPPKYAYEPWDQQRPHKSIFDMLRRMSKVQIIWGGNYFADYLPASRGWLFWDKQFDHTSNFSHGELAWTSLNMRLQKFVLSSKAETRGGQDRVHPTQKPVALMRWCFSYLAESQRILDPFMGTGTTGVASLQLGHPFIGIEIEPRYFETACRRIETELAQLHLFLNRPLVHASVQEVLF